VEGCIVGQICTILFQINNNAGLEVFCDKLVNANFFPAASNISKSDKHQIGQIKPYQFDDTFHIDFGSIVYKFNQINMMCIRINRGWSDFLSYPPTTEITREICLEAMEYFNSMEAIYLSDMYSYDYFYDNTSLPDIKKSLISRLGPPAKNIEDIYKEFEEHIETDGYYIEIR
jgi:hypothetical protein